VDESLKGGGRVCTSTCNIICLTVSLVSPRQTSIYVMCPWDHAVSPDIPCPNF
jgi:hypothetical protein